MSDNLNPVNEPEPEPVIVLPEMLSFSLLRLQPRDILVVRKKLLTVKEKDQIREKLTPILDPLRVNFIVCDDSISFLAVREASRSEIVIPTQPDDRMDKPVC